MTNYVFDVDGTLTRSRGRINEYHCTTVSAIKCIDDQNLIQFVHHSPYAHLGKHINERHLVHLNFFG